MAHVHAFGDAAPAARPFIHLGATSAFVTDNADLLVMREALRPGRARLGAALRLLARRRRPAPRAPDPGYTHLQPAQLTTVGKRVALWMQGFAARPRGDPAPRRPRSRCSACKGTTGTQASFLDLFAGDHEKVRRLDRLVAEKMGVPRVVPVSGQTYPRKMDAQVLCRPRRRGAVGGQVRRRPAPAAARAARCSSRSRRSRWARRPWPTSATRCAPSGSSRWRAS